MKVDPEEIVIECVECGKEIEELEAVKHTFIFGGTPVSFHRECCPITVNGQECKAAHLLYD